MKNKIFFYIFILINSLCLASTDFGAYEISIGDGSIAMVSEPNYFNPNSSYPLMIALHGISENAKTSIDRWGEVAAENGYILLAPQGTGSRNSFVADVTANVHNIFKYISKIKETYKLIPDDVIVAGFSMGGNFAIDLALRHPHRFPRALCVFGFFGERHAHWARIQNREYIENQKYYLITGDKDVTCEYLQRAHRAILYKGGKVKLDIYQNLYHSLPPDFYRKFKDIEDFFYGDDYKELNPDICLNQ